MSKERLVREGGDEQGKEDGDLEIGRSMSSGMRMNGGFVLFAQIFDAN